MSTESAFASVSDGLIYISHDAAGKRKTRHFEINDAGGQEAKKWVLGYGIDSLMCSSSLDFPDEEGSTHKAVNAFRDGFSGVGPVDELAQAAQALLDTYLMTGDHTIHSIHETDCNACKLAAVLNGLKGDA